VFEVIYPGESVIRLVLLGATTIAILIVFYLLSTPKPTYILVLRLLLRVNHNLHAHSIKIILFVMVQDVKFYPG